MKSMGGNKDCFEVAGSSGINTSFYYPRLPIVELILPMVEMMLWVLKFNGVLERGVLRCPYWMERCRTFCEDAIPQTVRVALRAGWLPGQCYTFFDSAGVFLR
jgi:hypothetical protein